MKKFLGWRREEIFSSTAVQDTIKRRRVGDGDDNDRLIRVQFATMSEDLPFTFHEKSFRSVLYTYEGKGIVISAAQRYVYP
jgi:hypothetical protein